MLNLSLRSTLLFLILSFGFKAVTFAAEENPLSFKVAQVNNGVAVLMTPADFYSPSAEFFGPPYYSWPLTKHDPHEKMLIQYVIYQNVNLDVLKNKFKIDPIAKKDYRYIRFEDAMGYLDENIDMIYKNLERRSADMEIDTVTERTCTTSRYISAYEMLAVYNKTALFLAKHFQYAAPK